ncbi:hypothetical protein V1264_009026 [Littorina saxatilis]|uniref:Cadherin domain-containing protein n=1 Tax=Littorina saxatilis TaxID=31220 RepID=A0AAN9AQP3_9CAEN
MMKITCTSSGGEALSVRLARITPSYPCSTCFTVLPCPSGVDFCLTYLAGQGTLNVRLASRYQVTYSCIDSDGRYSSSTADVFIEPNEPPYFEEATYPGLKVEGEISQTAGVTVQATDEDGDALTYSMVTYPDTSALEIDSLSGQIRVASGKSLKSECRNHYSAQVYVKDKYHTTKAGPIAVALNVKGKDSFTWSLQCHCSVVMVMVMVMMMVMMVMEMVMVMMMVMMLMVLMVKVVVMVVVMVMVIMVMVM